MRSTIFATGLGAPEGPVALPNGEMYITEMSNSTLCVSKLDAQGRRSVVKPTKGRPNGLAVDGDGLLWIAEAGLRALICMAPDGREILRLEGGDDGRFLFPNDLAFGPDGHLYMTDSGMALSDFLDGQTLVENFLDLDWDGRVYEIDPKAGKVLRKIDSRIRFTNGIAFDPQDKLYANASLPGDIYVYDVFGTGSPKRELFGNVLQPDTRPGFKGPDGMKFGADGRLYCAVYGQSNITVLDANGAVAERLPLEGPNPTNCVFALTGSTLFVTEVEKGQVEAIATPCGGLALHEPRLGLA
ncbi:MAG: SMP-30/gluconolactonase/LRE family protein [Acetobacteraceae bacterium]|nr:SMP-30/gluconolactonase/LRE family protein [Acetobacteraceae bacterium]